MLKCINLALVLFVCLGGFANVYGQQSTKKSKVKVELRWVENEQIEGLTEDEGFQCSCDPDDIVYPHKEPALVVTAADVIDVEMAEHDFSSTGLDSQYFMVTIHLTKEAREKLASKGRGSSKRLVTVAVDGKYWGVFPYVRSNRKSDTSKTSHASRFTPQVGYFSSYAEAKRLVDSFWPQ